MHLLPSCARQRVCHRCKLVSCGPVNGIRIIARMDTIPKDTIPNGHNPECRQSQMDTIPIGHHPETHDSEWTQSRKDTIPNGHNPERTQSRMDTIPNEHLPSY